MGDGRFRELSHETQTLVGHARGASPIASVSAEMLKVMMGQARS
jgi:hypothetical protein